MFEREVTKQVKADDGYEDEELKKILDEAKEVGLKEFEGKKKGNESLIKRCRSQLVDKLNNLVEKYLRENMERKRKSEMYMGELVTECSKVSE